VLGPIFNREFLTVPRREKHHAARLAVLVLLWMLGITAWQASVGFTREAYPGETARFGLLLFQMSGYLELTLLIFFAALSAASTVSQEKDRRTFILLLLTDMRDYEIVLGKMLGSLLPILIFFLVTVPFYALCLLLGGVEPFQVVQVCLVMLSTALAAGSVGALVALWRDKTFQALSLSVLALVFYLFFAQGLGLLFGSSVTSWLDPFSALRRILEPRENDAQTPPIWGFVICSLLVTVLLNAFGIFMLRKWNPSGEPIIQRDSETDEKALSPEERAKAHAAPGQAREVWENPILWREIRTLAYGRRPLLVKLAFGMIFALICYYAWGELSQPGGRKTSFAAAYGLVPIAVLSLLLVSTQAMTSITSERDGKALDLLLVTDLSPREFIFGKLGGILYNTKEFILPTLILAIFYAFKGAYAFAREDESLILQNFLPLICVLGALLIFFAFVMILGLHISLRVENSRLAAVQTLGTVFFLCVGTLICIYLIIVNGGSLGNQLLSFSGFICLGIGGLWWVLSADRPSPALTLASIVAPIAMFYAVVNILIAKPGSEESSDPLIPFLVLGAALGFAISAMLVPLLSEFDVNTGRTTVAEE